MTPLLNNNNDNNGIKKASIAPLQYLSNFWRSLEMSLINCNAELITVAGTIENPDTNSNNILHY